MPGIKPGFPRMGNNGDYMEENLEFPTIPRANAQSEAYNRVYFKRSRHGALYNGTGPSCSMAVQSVWSVSTPVNYSAKMGFLTVFKSIRSSYSTKGLWQCQEMSTNPQTFTHPYKFSRKGLYLAKKGHRNKDRQCPEEIQKLSKILILMILHRPNQECRPWCHLSNKDRTKLNKDGKFTSKVIS